MKISFLTSGHDPYDERIFYHMAVSLSAHGHNIEISSSKSNAKEITGGIQLNCFEGDRLKKREKIEQFIRRLAESTPDSIICSEPLPVYAAHKYLKKYKKEARVIYDITEWYPSKKNLTRYNPLIKWFYFIKLLMFNIGVSRFADSFIFGEWYKSKPYRLFFPHKPFIYTSYYPHLKYIKNSPPLVREGHLRLSYSGKISHDKGYNNFLAVLRRLSELKPELKIEVKIIGWYERIYKNESTEDIFKSEHQNVTIKFYDRQHFNRYIELIKDTDIFLDLRSNDYENSHCLPIRLFYFAAMGRPVIFSDLKAIRKEADISSFGFLVDPDCTEETVKLLIEYIDEPALYYNHCNDARKIAEERYNWGSLETQFIKFVTTG